MKTSVLFTFSVGACRHAVLDTANVNKLGNQINVNLFDSTMTL